MVSGVWYVMCSMWRTVFVVGSTRGAGMAVMRNNKHNARLAPHVTLRIKITRVMKKRALSVGCEKMCERICGSL